MRTLSLLLTLTLAAPVHAEPAEAEDEARPWYWVGFGSAGFAFIVGGLMHATALDTLDTAESFGPGRDRELAVDDYEQQRTTALVSYGVGVLAVGAGLYLLFSDGAGIDDPPATVGPDGLQVRW